MQEEIDSFFIAEDEAGERLDKILASRLSTAGSRTYFQYLISEHKVLLNGVPVKKRIKPKSGDEIEIEYVLTPELTLSPENIPLKILFEDDALLVVDKPAGMVVHPAPGNWTGTFVNALLFHCQGLLANPSSSSSQEWRPGIVHRLDKDTSGLLIAAKTSRAQQRLMDMFAERKIYKEYLAICIGNLNEGVIDAPIGRHPIQRKLMAVVEEGGRNALTEYRALASNGKLSLVRVVIATGRTHQIRVHMKYRGAPVLGDPVYGNPSWNAKYRLNRQMLHAYRLRFDHPLTGESLAFEAEIPEDMRQVIKDFGDKGINI